MRVAVVLVALNEEEAIRKHLPAVLAAADEVVVSDGGSSDRTAELAQEMGARVVSGAASRGTQLNRGAAETDSEILLFLHADTSLPVGALVQVREAVSRGAVGGGFLVRFDVGAPILRLGEKLINLRTRLTHAPLGDQAQFAARAAFEQLEGFREWPILEDLDFVMRLRKCGRIAVLSDPVTTAARRFLRGGVIRTVLNNWLIWSLYFAGISPHRLARLYRHIR